MGTLKEHIVEVIWRLSVEGLKVKFNYSIEQVGQSLERPVCHFIGLKSTYLLCCGGYLGYWTDPRFFTLL